MCSLELYVHLITFYISGKCFVPHNQLLHCSCNIGTAAHLLFTKSLSSEFQEWFDKVLYPLEFFSGSYGCYTYLEWMVFLTSHYLNLEQKDPVVVVSLLYLPSSLSNDLTDLLVSPFLYVFSFIFQLNVFLPPPHVAYCWDIVRTTCYQEMPLVNCWVKSWWRFFSTRGCSSLL